MTTQSNTMSAIEPMARDSIPELEVSLASGRIERVSPPLRVSDEIEIHHPPELVPGDIIADRYVIERTIGAGGHGAIHRARHIDLDMPVAVKVLHLDKAPLHGELILRFLREAKIAARVRHRNVLSVHDTGRLADGSPFIVMELIEGEDLEQRIARGPLPISSIVDLGRQLFSGLAAIAEAGVLHRDVKPGNVMLHRETDGQVLLKLVDFGIARARTEVARLTATGAIVGTPHYMSPEQLRGEDLDARADMYAACAVLYEATTGRPPFDGTETALVIGQILSGKLVPIREQRPDCPPALAELIERGLARNRAERASHPLRVVTALDAVARFHSLPAGALAWAGDVALSFTLPIDLMRRRHTPPQPRVDPPPEGPILPGPDEPATPVTEPERPDEIDDPPPQIPPRKARVALAIAAAAVLGMASVGALAPEQPAAASPAAESPAAPIAIAPPTTPAPNQRRPVDVDVLLDEGLEALARGEVEGALAHYRAAAMADPTRAEAHRGRGLAAARAGLDDESIAAFERYLVLAPDAPDIDRVRNRLEAERVHRSQRLDGAPPATRAVARRGRRTPR